MKIANVKLVACLFAVSVSLSAQDKNVKSGTRNSANDRVAVEKEPVAERVFSGPQVGETMVPFRITGIFDEQASENIASEAMWKKPTIIFFVHEITRPSIGLTRSVMNYAATRKKDGLESAVVFLGDDVTALEERIKRARRALPRGVRIGLSDEGQEGPGSYGLNRKVTVTVLVADKGTVTANFAIIQPTAAIDAPRIAKAITQVVGGKEPGVKELGLQRYMESMRKRSRPGRGAQDLQPELQAKLRELIQKSNTPEVVARVAAEIEKSIDGDQEAQAAIGVIASRIKDANYGTESAQRIIRQWAKKYGSESHKTQQKKTTKHSADDTTTKPADRPKSER